MFVWNQLQEFNYFVHIRELSLAISVKCRALVYFNCVFFTASVRADLISKLREARISESESEKCVNA